MKSEQRYGQAGALVPMWGCVATCLRPIDAHYRHLAAMFGGMWAKVPTINGYSGTQPKDFPAYTYQPSLEELIAVLGPDWSGRLVVIEWGPPIRRRVYQVEKGGRFVLIESS